MRRLLLTLPAAALIATAVPAYPLPGAPYCPLFPANNVWHSDVSALPVHARSAAWLASMGAPTRRLHPDFGPSGGSMPYGIPYAVVAGSHQKVAVDFEYAGESDPGPYPLGPDTPVEGGADAGGDRHALVIDRDTCKLYETWDTHYSASGSYAGSGAVFDLRSNALRPAGWTSADAAGLPVFAGLLRRDEVLAGRVDHAIRVTASRTDRSYVWPARHHAGAASDPNLPPMGARFRLKSSFPLAGYRADTQVVLRAFQRHGLILADNGSNWYFQGTAEDGWPAAFLDELKSIPASAFEAVDAASLMVSPDSAAARQPAGPTPSPKWTHWSSPRPARTPARPALAPAVATAAPSSPPAAASVRPSPSVAVAVVPPPPDVPPPARPAAVPGRSSPRARPPWWLLALSLPAAALLATRRSGRRRAPTRR